MNGASNATSKTQEVDPSQVIEQPPSKKDEANKKYRRLVHNVNVSANRCEPVSGPVGIDLRTKKVVQAENPKVEGKK